MDGGGVLYDRPDPRHVASLIHRLVSDAGHEEDVLRAQDAALERLLAKDFPAMVRGFVRDALDAPRARVPSVAADFWRQYQLVQELDAIHETRPAAFRALPIAPEEQGAVADLSDRRR
jgi:hypothetical protein